MSTFHDQKYIAPDSEWHLVKRGRKPKKEYIYPVRKYWNGFRYGKECWFIELNNGRIIPDIDSDYTFYDRILYNKR